MRVFLIHIRDPQFYALPAANRAKNGRIWVMGLPIGIMSLSARAETHRPRTSAREATSFGGEGFELFFNPLTITFPPKGE